MRITQLSIHKPDYYLAHRLKLLQSSFVQIHFTRVYYAWKLIFLMSDLFADSIIMTDAKAWNIGRHIKNTKKRNKTKHKSKYKIATCQLGKLSKRLRLLTKKKCKNGQKQNTGRLPNYCWNAVMADTQGQSSKEWLWKNTSTGELMRWVQATEWGSRVGRKRGLIITEELCHRRLCLP